MSADQKRVAMFDEQAHARLTQAQTSMSSSGVSACRQCRKSMAIQCGQEWYSHPCVLQCYSKKNEYKKTNVPTCSPLNGEYDCSFLLEFWLFDQKLWCWMWKVYDHNGLATKRKLIILSTLALLGAPNGQSWYPGSLALPHTDCALNGQASGGKRRQFLSSTLKCTRSAQFATKTATHSYIRPYQAHP